MAADSIEIDELVKKMWRTVEGNFSEWLAWAEWSKFAGG